MFSLFVSISPTLKPKDSGLYRIITVIPAFLPPFVCSFIKDKILKSTSCIVSHFRLKEKINHAVSTAWESMVIIYF